MIISPAKLRNNLRILIRFAYYSNSSGSFLSETRVKVESELDYFNQNHIGFWLYRFRFKFSWPIYNHVE